MKRQSVVLWTIVGFALVAGVLIGTHYFMNRYFEPPRSGGEYGDRFGVADAIFSGIALTIATVTLLYQAREIRFTLEGQRQAVELQALASLNDAIRVAIEDGSTKEYEYDGTHYGAKDLQEVLLLKLLKDYEQIDRHRSKGKPN